MDERPVAVVTGGNSGIGRAVAVHLAAQGMRVFATVRRTSSVDKLRAMAAEAGVEVEQVEMDVTDDDGVRAAFAGVMAAAGRVDVLVNSAGVAAIATVEEASLALFREVLEVNFHGTVRCIQAVLPAMRQRRSGCIVNVSSVAGRVAVIAQAPYVASKWALEGVSEELALEVAPFGIRVAIVEPGVTRTAMFAKTVEAPDTDVYQDHYRRMFQMYAAGLRQPSDPFEVAAVVHHAVTTDEPKLRYTVSWGGDGMVDGRAGMSDEDWVAMGASADDAEYYRRFREAFGVSIDPAG